MIKCKQQLKPLTSLIFATIVVFMLMTSEALGDPNYQATLKAGFPVDVTGVVQSSPNIIDLDGDGKQEIIIGTLAGYIYVINSSGSIIARPFQVSIARVR